VWGNRRKTKKGVLSRRKERDKPDPGATASAATKTGRLRPWLRRKERFSEEGEGGDGLGRYANHRYLGKEKKKSTSNRRRQLQDSTSIAPRGYKNPKKSN